MRTTVVVGVRVTEAEGLSFIGIDEINAALRAGKKVTALEPEGALFQQITGSGGGVQHALSGFAIKVIVED